MPRNKKHKITKEEFDILQPRCNCICNQLIQWSDRFRYRGIPKFINGHQNRGVNNPHYGKHLSEDTKNKLRESNSGENHWLYGKHHTKDSCKKMSDAKKGKKLTEETKLKLSNILSGRVSPMKGRKHSQESKNKTSLNNKGKHYWSDKKRKELSDKKKGIPKSEEHKHKLSEIQKTKCGEKSPSWKGGISYLPYCWKFNEPLKEAVRNRDSRLCQLCGKDEVQNGKKQTVHHIHYDKENCYPDLITLCNSCNSKVNKNRDFWEELFTFMLWIRGMLYWKPT